MLIKTVNLVLVMLEQVAIAFEHLAYIHLAKLSEFYHTGQFLSCFQ
jgi:hypothetical protein